MLHLLSTSMEAVGGWVVAAGVNAFTLLFNDLSVKRRWKSQRRSSDKLLGLNGL